MALIDTIEITRDNTIHRIELHQGDLTDPSEEKCDLLVVSAFPGDYLPTPSSLIGALDRSGISVEELAHHKAVDLREAFSCWLSPPLGKESPSSRYGKILCFEPPTQHHPAEVVGDIFRAIAPFLGDQPPIKSVAMPIVAAGDQGNDISTMASAILEAATRWLEIGLPLEKLKIYAYSREDATLAAEIFSAFKTSFPTKPLSHSFTYDLFLSYSRTDSDVANIMADELQKLGKNVYLDTHSLEPGASWQTEIFTAMDDCDRVVTIYSPDYLGSKVCQEEFNIAWARSRREDRTLLYPVYWESAPMPTYMTLLHYIDCRERKVEALMEACQKIANSPSGV